MLYHPHILLILLFFLLLRLEMEYIYLFSDCIVMAVFLELDFQMKIAPLYCPPFSLFNKY